LSQLRTLHHFDCNEPAMFRLSLVGTIAAAAALAALQTTAAYAEGTKVMSSANASVVKPLENGHITANGLKYFYQIHGKGEPLLLLHGGLGQFEIFEPVLPALTANRQVIGVDLHGHGRTELGDRDISLIDMGNDMAVILKQLGYDQVDVLGYSLGGKVAFRLAAQHPAMVRRLVLVSVGCAQDGVYPEMLPLQAQMGSGMMEVMRNTPVYQSYVAVAPHPEDIPRLLDRIGASMRKPYDWSEDVKKRTCR
jgi:pimeloyl-ACP methyl ester carboxylesterase